MTAATVLRAAAVRVRKGWCQGSGYEPGPICAYQALFSQCADNRQREDASIALRQTIGEHSIIDWNDSPGQTAESVAATMERAAEKLEATS